VETSVVVITARTGALLRPRLAGAGLGLLMIISNEAVSPRGRQAARARRRTLADIIWHRQSLTFRKDR
jgi:hypothetical protein